jgi:hypothetical protein
VVDDEDMARALMVLVGGLALSLLGTLTTTDVISLREVFHAANVPVLSGLVIAARESMGTSLAHALEPACAVLGMAAMGFTLRGRIALPLARLQEQAEDVRALRV